MKILICKNLDINSIPINEKNIDELIDVNNIDSKFLEFIKIDTSKFKTHNFKDLIKTSRIRELLLPNEHDKIDFLTKYSPINFRYSLGVKRSTIEMYLKMTEYLLSLLKSKKLI